jgi:general secretion pathway protein L
MAATDLAPLRARPAWRQRVSAFWRWWTGELAQLVPARFSAIAGGGIPLVAFDNGDLVLLDTRGGGALPVRIAIDQLDPAGQRTALREMLQAAGENRGRVRVRLARDDVLVRRVWLPAATEENLTQVIGFEMDRLTPFRAEDVYFDHRIVGRDPASGQVQVELAVARRESVDARVERLRSLGASVQGVLVPQDASAKPLDLLPHEQRGQRDAGRERWLVPSLGALVLALLAIALLLPVYKKRDAVVALLPQVGQAKQEAEATDAVRAALEKQVADYNFVMTRKQGTWPALAFVEEISRLLPDNTWVQQLDLKTGKSRELTITGETVSSSKLIEILEQSTLLQNAAPRGAVTRGSTAGMERFMISAEAKPRPLPPPRPLLEVVEALPNVSAAPAPQPTPTPTTATTAAPAAAPAAAPPAASGFGPAPSPAATPAPVPAKPPSTVQPPPPAKAPPKAR